MGVPVLVVHGVGNRNKQSFVDQVGRLQARVGTDFELIPVFWGHLGAAGAGFDDVLPGGDESESQELAPAAPTVLPPARSASVNAERQAAIIAAAAAAQMTQEEGMFVPADDGVQAAVEEGLPRTTYLRTVSDPEVLAAVGELVGKAAAPTLSSTDEVFGALGRVVDSVLSGADRLVGAVIGDVLGNVNHDLRATLVPGVAGFLGDVFAYQHHRRLIQDAIWTEIDGHDSTRGSGTAERPVHVVAHSLGGVISFHAATAADAGRPLFIDGFVTFGSQAGFFHILDPRESGLAPYVDGTPVVVRSIRRWTNLWEPLDPLAFLAGKVFVLEDAGGRADTPVDRPTSHLASSGLFTHGTYWESDELVDAVRSTLR
jgi:hypothetical protein